MTFARGVFIGAAVWGIRPRRNRDRAVRDVRISFEDAIPAVTDLLLGVLFVIAFTKVSQSRVLYNESAPGSSLR